jgi:hypothetical protein
MISYYSLQIDVPDDKFESGDRILGVKSKCTPFGELRIVQEEDKPIQFSISSL